MNQTAIIQLKSGLHARPASKFVKLANNYQSTITLSCNGKTANAKSMVHVLMINANCQQKLLVFAEGPDEEDAVETLCAFVSDPSNG